MKKGKIIGLAVIATGLLTGCVDHMPDMNDEQSALIAEYAADMLLKYSPNYNYKIADEEVLAEVMEETVTEEETEEVTEEASTEQMVEVTTQVNVMEEMEAALDIIDAAEVDFAEVFEIEDAEIRYENLEICAAYPQEAAGTGFAVNAAEGKSLVVIHMLIENTSEAVITCDLFEKDMDISINMNGGNFKKASGTMLVNDFATYMEEIPAGESREAVIVAEVNKITAEEVHSCILRISTAEASVTAKLQ